nr:MAG TPA: hypothetical protein [Caudoviricetes sp.]
MDAVPLHGVFAKIGCQMIILLIIAGSLLAKSTLSAIGCIYQNRLKSKEHENEY